MELHQVKSRLDIRRKFSGRVVSHWNRLLRKMVAALSLSEFRGYLDNAFSDMVLFQKVL